MAIAMAAPAIDCSMRFGFKYIGTVPPRKDGGCMKRFQPKKWMRTEAPYPVQTHDQPRLQNDLA
jgi:hypothetical protein